VVDIGRYNLADRPFLVKFSKQKHSLSEFETFLSEILSFLHQDFISSLYT
jgi:hypothetical protein